MTGISLYQFTFIETGLIGGILGRDLGGGVENCPEELRALDEGEVGGLGNGLDKIFEHEERMGGK